MDAGGADGRDRHSALDAHPLRACAAHRLSRRPAHGSAAYRRAVRAHANCVENLPVFGAIVLVAFAARVDTPWLDTLAFAFIAGRVGQTLTHTLFAETNPTVLIRFLFFFAQVLCMIGMAAEILARVA
jgi:uncharacterized MAPEG superfamily protein